MQKQPLTAVVTQNDKGYYFVNIEELPGVYTWGDTLDKIMKGIHEALDLHIDGLKEDNELPAGLENGYALSWKLPINIALELLSLDNRALASFSKINNSLLSQYRSGRKVAGRKQKEKLTDSFHQLGTMFSQLQIV